MTKKTISITLTIFFISLTACGYAQMKRIRREVLSDPNTSPAVKQLIEEKKIAVGMTQREVVATWGNPNPLSPCNTKTVSYGDVYESWDYSKVGYCTGFILRFRNGKLTGWSR